MHCIAVTGANGFVGRRLVSRLNSEGYKVVAVTRAIPRAPIAGSHITVTTDYKDSLLLEKLLAGCSIVIHLVARAHRTSEAFDCSTLDLYRAANVDTLVSVAKAARGIGAQRLLFLSSIGVLGSVTNRIPLSESSPPSPEGPYAITKLEAETALIAELSDGPTDWVVLRPPLVYGPGCPGNLDRLLRLASSAPLLPFGALQNRRTLISIENLLDALLIAAVHPSVSRGIFVVSDSEDIDVANILLAFLHGLKRGAWRLLPVPPSLIAIVCWLLGKGALWNKLSGELCVDSSAFRTATGWVPSVSPRIGLRSAAAAFALSP